MEPLIGLIDMLSNIVVQVDPVNFLLLNFSLNYIVAKDPQREMRDLLAPYSLLLWVLQENEDLGPP